MADFAYGTEVQNQIAYALFGGNYSSLTSDQKAALDGTQSTSPPTKGFALLAWQQVGQIAQWWYQAGATTTPDVWQHWFVARACKLMAVQYRPDRYPLFKEMDEAAQASAIKSFQKEAATGSTVSSQATTTNIQTVRYETMQAAINRSPSIFLSPAEIDSATLRCLRILWNQADWLFRRREVVMTVTPPTPPATLTTVTFDLTGSEAFDSFVSTRLTYTDTSGYGIHCFWADPDKFADVATLNVSQTGRPMFFRVTQATPTTFTWQFAPAPDQAYTLRALVNIQGPADPTNATDTTPFDLFPVEFHQIIRDWVLGECLSKRDGQAKADGNELRKRCQDELERLATKFADVGNVTTDAGSVRDVYNDLQYFGNYNMLGGAM